MGLLVYMRAARLPFLTGSLFPGAVKKAVSFQPRPMIAEGGKSCRVGNAHHSF